MRGRTGSADSRRRAPAAWAGAPRARPGASNGRRPAASPSSRRPRPYHGMPAAMKICVIGTGYEGKVAGAGFSDMGNDVTCCDLDKSKIDGLNRGELPIYEPGLDKLVETNAAEGRLLFTTDVAKGVAGADIILLAVGTPPGPDGSADLQYIFMAAEDGADALTGWSVIVTKSTVPVGTGDKFVVCLLVCFLFVFVVVLFFVFLLVGC